MMFRIGFHVIVLREKGIKDQILERAILTGLLVITKSKWEQTGSSFMFIARKQAPQKTIPNY